MKVVLAKTAGFCFGVNRAVTTVYDEIKQNNDEKIFTYGPIIHNDIVVNDLKSKGVNVVSDFEELEGLKDATIVIRSHGVAKDVYDKIDSLGFKLVDATCPFVKKIHTLVSKNGSEGKHIIIIGDKNHPEVKGIKGWCEKEPTIIGNAEEAMAFNGDLKKQYTLVSQTTFNHDNFKNIVEIITKKGYDIVVLNTICNATHERQLEAENISKEVDLMIVIGNKDSSNTRKLYEICKNNCEKTYYIQTLEDLDLCNLQSCTCVGITAGASTPNIIIEEVHNYVRNEF